MADKQFFEEEEFTTQFNGRVIWRIAQHALPYWRRLLGFISLIALVACLEASFTYITALIIDEGIIPQDRARLIELITLYALLALLNSAAVFGFIYLVGTVGQRLQYDLRGKMFNHLQDLSLSYFNRTPIGWIMSRVTSDSNKIAELVTWGLIDTVWAVLNIVTAIAFMMLINWPLALLVMLTLPLLLAISFYFKHKILREYRLVRKINSKVTGAFNENISGVRVVKALTREQKNLAEFSELSSSLYHAGYRAAWLSALFLPMVQIVGAFALGGIVWYGGLQVEVGGMTIGGLQAFITYLTTMLFPIQDLARVYAHMQNSVASAERILSLIDVQPEIVNRPHAVEVAEIAGAIEFEQVDFYYEADNPVLSDFNLRVAPGEMIALVGPTGGGKSTIVNLVCRFYEPKKGVIRVDGRDYTELTLETLQARLGVVLQTPHLFSGTIRDNIRYGHLAATDEAVEAAAQMMHAHTFIKQLPHGYDEQVGEGGNLLSTGQKQLISLARAVLVNPRILIMDEATSAVDTLTEQHIQQGMQALMAGRTTFVIAHRLSTITQADRILVIEKGRITEMGNHQELLQQQGHYHQLYRNLQTLPPQYVTAS